MTKKNVLKTLDTSSYFSLILASIFVLLYSINGFGFGEIIIMRLSIILYGAAFLMLVVLCVLKLIYMKNDTKENDEVLVDKTKESKPWLYVRLVFTAICFAFTVVFFVVL